LMAFGGAGPLHANALGELTQAWPVIVPPGPGILCAYGDATTRLRNEASKTIIVNMKAADGNKLEEDLLALAESAKDGMGAGQGGDVDPKTVEVRYEIDIRYSGQGLVLSIPADMKDIKAGKFDKISADFDDLHEQLFTFRLTNEKEFVNLRAIVLGPPANVELSAESASSNNKVEDAAICDHSFYYDGAMHDGKIYDRAKLESGHVVKGPAVITEMDSTTVVLPGYEAKVDSRLNLLLSPIA
jgi:N-methylhydantoinase A